MFLTRDNAVYVSQARDVRRVTVSGYRGIYYSTTVLVQHLLHTYLMFVIVT